MLVGTLMADTLCRFVRDGCIDGRTMNNISGTLVCSSVLSMVFSFTIITEEIAFKQGKIEQENKNIACNLRSQFF